MKKLTILMFLALLVGMIVPSVSAATSIDEVLSVTDVEINGKNYDDNDLMGDQDKDFSLERGEDIEIELFVESGDLAMEDIEVEAEFNGYRYNREEREVINDFTRPFDLDENDSKRVTLDIEVPVDMDIDEDTYLVITLSAYGQYNPVTYTFKVNVEGIDEEDAVQVERASFSPDVVKAGFGFTSLVRVENFGDDDYDDVCATVKVLGLSGAKDTECIDELEADDSETLEEFAIRIPEDAKPGTYDVEVSVEFDKYRGTTYFGTIEVIEGYDAPVEETVKLVVNVPESLDVMAGKEVTYPVTLSNQGTADATITLSATNVDSFGTARFDPSSLLILKAGETKTVMLNIEVDEDAEGTETFLLNVQADGDSKQVALTASVEDNGSEDLRRGLEIGLIVLVIILIILGLIVGFTRMKKNDGEEETQTYY